MPTRPAERNDLDALCRQVALVHGGLCLAESVESETLPVRWRCAAGHHWTAPPSAVERWCPECAKAAGAPATGEAREEACRRIVGLHGGEVAGFTDPKMAPESRFRVRCARDHLFDIRLAALLGGDWCPACARQDAIERQRSLELRKAQSHAIGHGGGLLTEVFVDSTTEMQRRHAGSRRDAHGHDFRRLGEGCLNSTRPLSTSRHERGPSAAPTPAEPQSGTRPRAAAPAAPARAPSRA